jgi:hypothetical protein
MPEQPAPNDRQSLDQDELQQRRLTDSVREAVERDLKRRYTWLGFIMLLITSGTIGVVVNQMLANAQLQLETARALQDHSTDRILKATEESEKLVKRTQAIQERFRETAQDAETRFDDLRSRASSLATELWHASNRNFDAIKELRSDLAQLTLVVEGVAGQRSLAESLPDPSVVKGIQDIKKSLKASEERIEAATNTSSRFFETYQSRIWGAWKIESWPEGFGESNSGTLLVYGPDDHNTFKGTMFIIAALDRREILQDVEITVEEQKVVMKGTVVSGDKWANNEFEFELQGDELIGKSFDSRGREAEVTLRRMQ